MLKVVLLGGGNVAYHLTKQLLKSDIVKLVQVYNRSIEKISYLQSKTQITNNLKALIAADIYIISVSDDAIPTLSSQLKFKGKLVVHTSGSVAMDELKTNANKGVFYPLQTFSKNKEVDFSEIPICIEATSKKGLDTLETLAKSISKTCICINSEQRKNLHAAAVFVNNFVNHLYFIGNEICAKNNIPFNILVPLIKETANKISMLPPFEAQTGPAKRNDIKTIEKHKALLPINQQEIYTLLTKSIYSIHGEKL